MNDPLGTLRAVIGGNNRCHCIHVAELITRVDKLEANPRTATATFVPDPWGHAAGHRAPAAAAGEPRTASTAVASPALSLKLTATLGSIGYKDRPIFDQKMSLQEEYRFNGVKDGFKWKTKVQAYFTTCAPVLM